MKALCSLVFLVVQAAWFVPPSGAQDAIAVITELKFNRGDIHLRSSRTTAPTNPAVLQSLYPGDVIQTTKDAMVVVLFTDGSRTVTVDEKNSTFEVRASQAKEGQASARIKEFAGLLLGKKKPPSYVALSVRGKTQPPTLVSPRNTKLLDNTPTFHWMGMSQQPGTLKLFGPGGLVWSADNISLTKIAYPASAPRLEPNVEYAWVIERKDRASAKASFKLLSPVDAKGITESLDALSAITGASKTTLAVLKANFLTSKDLFHDAREILTEAIGANGDEPTLHFVLAELYDKTGLKNLANDEYNEAEFLAKAKQ